MRSLCANLYSPRPGISYKITLWILFLSKSCQPHLCPLLTFPTAMRHLHRAKAAELLAHQFWLCIRMPLHFFTFQQIKPHIPLGLWQWCHQPHHSEGSCQTGLVVGDIPENSPKCCWDRRRSIFPSHQQETSCLSPRRNCHWFSKYTSLY